MPRIPVYYTFGNHQHWVDLQWLWGYHVMPGSIRDMLHFCKETGAKGCVNFDGIGYEKLAAEDPETLAIIRREIEAGRFEIVGCSYGQPYGLFHGGEANIRQRIYGVRTAMRLFGVRPKTFWEEEFDFFPQLPQVLKGCGFEFASLFFQWTWHTPEVPKEDAPVIWWEAPDGSRLLTATRNKLNLHQWPEDFDGLLEELAAKAPSPFSPELAEGEKGEGVGVEGSGLNPQSTIHNPQTPTPLILQWLELMPTPDWMCRSEVLLPRMKELLNDPRFEVKMATLGEYLATVARDNDETTKRRSDDPSRITHHASHELNPAIPVRRYAMHEVWHGLSLGKNGDRMRRLSAQVEGEIKAAETLSAILGLFGRPYAQWDVYPTYELEEAWRELLAAQHHDNDECEGLCGRGGLRGYEKAGSMARTLLQMQLRLAAKRLDKSGEKHFQFGYVSWIHDVRVLDRASAWATAPGVLGWGWEACDLRPEEVGSPPSIGLEGLYVEGLLRVPLGELQGRVGGKTLLLREAANVEAGEGALIGSFRAPGFDAFVRASVQNCLSGPGLDLEVGVYPKEGDLDPGVNAGWQLPFRPTFPDKRVLADVPLGVYEVRISGKRLRKYPTGDWMTSPQWFEEIEHPFTSWSFVDFLDEVGSGVLVLHDGSQQWLLDERGARVVLGVVDPWDEDRATSAFGAAFRIIPHKGLTNADRVRLSAEFRAQRIQPVIAEPRAKEPDLPASFSAIRLEPKSVIATAFYRETEDFSGKNLENYAGKGMGYPYVLRLVEYDGVPADVDLVLPGPIAKAFRTNLMGEVDEELLAEGLSQSELDAKPLAATQEELDRFGIRPQRLRLSMRPFEIATLYLDLVPGRKQFRDLDADRKVWATVHRVASS